MPGNLVHVPISSHGGGGGGLPGQGAGGVTTDHQQFIPTSQYQNSLPPHMWTQQVSLPPSLPSPPPYHFTPLPSGNPLLHVIFYLLSFLPPPYSPSLHSPCPSSPHYYFIICSIKSQMIALKLSKKNNPPMAIFYQINLNFVNSSNFCCY